MEKPLIVTDHHRQFIGNDNCKGFTVSEQTNAHTDGTVEAFAAMEVTSSTVPKDLSLPQLAHNLV